MRRNTYRIFLGDDAAPAAADFYENLTSIEIDEHAELPATLRLKWGLSVNGQGGGRDLAVVTEEALQPYARIAVVVESQTGDNDECVFDGYVLSHDIHLDPNTTASWALVVCEDASCLMNIKQRVREFACTDGEAANQIFEDGYGFTPAEENLDDDSSTHSDDKHTLMQRGTDRQFLTDLARRAGKLFRVACRGRPGENIGYFAKPDLDADAAATLIVNHVEPEQVNVRWLAINCNVARPATTVAHTLLTQKDAVDGSTSESGLRVMDGQSLAEYCGDDEHVMEARLTTTADSAVALSQRAAALLREAGWFVRCEGETFRAQLAAGDGAGVLRVGHIVQVNGAGTLHSGPYLVWRVQHSLSASAHRMRFTLVRNAVG